MRGDGEPRPQPPLGARLEPRQRERLAPGAGLHALHPRGRGASSGSSTRPGWSGSPFPGYPTVGKQELYTELDALGVNDYFGWYPGPQGSIADRDALGAYLERLHRDYPRQALFVTEFGAEANRPGPVTEKGTYAFQQDFLTYHLQRIRPESPS